jgi:hypothetical protein
MKLAHNEYRLAVYQGQGNVSRRFLAHDCVCALRRAEIILAQLYANSTIGNSFIAELYDCGEVIIKRFYA